MKVVSSSFMNNIVTGKALTIATAIWQGQPTKHTSRKLEESCTFTPVSFVTLTVRLSSKTRSICTSLITERPLVLSLMETRILSRCFLLACAKRWIFIRIIIKLYKQYIKSNLRESVSRGHWCQVSERMDRLFNKELIVIKQY